MLTNCSQHENPLAPRSAWWCRTARANPARSIRDRICAKQLATATIQYLRLVGDTAWQRRRWVWMNSPSYSQAGGILRTYFGQECSGLVLTSLRPRLQLFKACLMILSQTLT